VTTEVDCFVDGYNLWHAIVALGRPDLKWLSLRDLARLLLGPDEVLVNVSYYSAIATYKPPESQARHQVYIDALRATDVLVRLGRFQRKTIYCKACRATTIGHEEKETDVNLAIDLMAATTILGRNAVLISQDSDFASTIESIRRIRGGVPVRPITPPGRYVSNRLQQVSGRKRATKLSIRHLERSQLPDEVRDPETGRVVARRPAKWR